MYLHIIFVWLQICYFFYKNIAFGVTLFYFEAYANFSGQTIYDDWYMTLFNVILTSFPVISLGVFEQDVSSEICLEVRFSSEIVDLSILTYETHCMHMNHIALSCQSNSTRTVSRSDMNLWVLGY